MERSVTDTTVSNYIDFPKIECVSKMRFMKIFFVVVVFCIVKSKFLEIFWNAFSFSLNFGSFSQTPQFFASFPVVMIRKNAIQKKIMEKR